MLALAALALAGCGSGEAASSPAPPAPPATIGIGGLPEPLSVTTAEPPTTYAPDDVSGSSQLHATAADSGLGSRPAPASRVPIGKLVDGNRVLVIGDSILASLADRYGGQLCDRLVPRGWAVEVDAEVGRRIDFGRQVLARREAAGWDAAVVMLGNNYDGDPAAFAAELEALLDELAPIPVVLLSVTRFRPVQDEVNYVIQAVAERHDDVRVADWAARTSDDAPAAERLLGADGLHLSDDGRVALAALISRTLGEAPAGSAGRCLRSPFTDDHGGSVTGEPGPSRRRSTPTTEP